MTVWILFHETNSGHSEVSDGYVEAVYATEALAEAAKLAAIRRLVAEGEAVYWNPDTEEEGPEDWTDDFEVFAFDVREDLPSPNPLAYTCPKCHAAPDIACHTGSARLPRGPHRARTQLATVTEAQPARGEQP